MTAIPTEAMIEAAQTSLGHEAVYVGASTVQRALSAALSAGQAQPVEAGEPCVICGQLHCDVCPAPAYPPVQAPVPPAVPGEVERMNAVEPGKEELVELLAHFERLGIKNRAAYQKALEDFRAALSVPLPEIEGGDKGDGWQPIETAPKHRSIILCTWWKDNNEAPFISEGYLDWDGVTWRDQAGRPLSPDRSAPTHWQPLPDAPSLAAPSAPIEGETP